MGKSEVYNPSFLEAKEVWDRRWSWTMRQHLRQLTEKRYGVTGYTWIPDQKICYPHVIF